MLTNPSNIVTTVKQEDVELMEDLQLNSYRFSISWARILPSKLADPLQDHVSRHSYWSGKKKQN